MQPMQPEPLTREAVISMLGEVDESVVADVISTHATPAHLLAAIEHLRNESSGWTSPQPPDEAVNALCEVLQQVWQPEPEPEYLGTD
jgi:uncharacterized protein (DUF2249 family)